MGKTNAEWSLDLNPPWATGPVGELWVASIGFWHDLMAEGAVQAVKANQMRSDTFHASALAHIGSERQLPRYPAETDAEYLARLRDAWSAWAKAGNFQAIIDQLALVGLTAEIWEQGQKGPAPDHDSANVWDWDDDLANWSRFFVVVTGHPWVRRQWGDPGMWGGTGETWGSNATAQDVATVQDIVTQWKSGKTIYPHVIVVLNAGTWAGVVPVTTGDRYDDPANRTDAAIYWDGYGVRAY